MSLAANKRSKRRKVKSTESVENLTSMSYPEFVTSELMKTNPEYEAQITKDMTYLTNGHGPEHKDSNKASPPSGPNPGEKWHFSHKDYSNIASMKESPSVELPSSPIKNGQGINLRTNPYQGPHSCTCKTCIERRSLESEAKLNSQMRHAWTQIRHLVRCAYHDPCVLRAIDSEEFHTYVNLLVSTDPHLLFQRVESQSREFVNDLKTRLLKQLTNGFNTPQLAYTFVTLMFDEYSRLLASARAVTPLLRQLEEDHLSQFNNITLEQHNMHLFQNMVYGESVVQHALNEVLNQLRIGSTENDDSIDGNIYASTLIRYLNFDTEMTQISIAWRDVQKMMDDFNDERVDAKRAKETEEEEQLNSQSIDHQLPSRQQQEPFEDMSEHKLSITLRQCSCSKSNPKIQSNAKVKQHQNGEPPVTEQTNQEESRHDHDCTSCLLSQSGITPFLHTDYLSNIKPPSVPSDDLEDSSGNSSDPPQIIEHPSLVVPPDLEEELDSNGSPPPATGSTFDHNAFFPYDGFLNPQRSFLLPFPHPRTFQHFRKHNPTNEFDHPGLTPSWLLSPPIKHNDSSSDVEPAEALNLLGSLAAHSQPVDGGNEYVITKVENCSASILTTSSPSMRSPPDGCATDNSMSRTCVSVTYSSSPCSNTTTAVCSSSVLADRLYKNSWSSSSSASFESASTVNFSDGMKVTKKTKASSKLRRKTHRKTRNSQRITDHHKIDLDSKAKILLENGLQSKESGVDGKITKNPDSEVDDDADDEYDEKEEEFMCKCEKCLATIKATNNFTLTKPYPSPLSDLNPNSQTCECTSCERLATVSFLAAQSIPQPHNLGAFGMGEVPGGNQAMQSPFYNPQDLQSLIHPHLYGLSSTLSGGPTASGSPSDPHGAPPKQESVDGVSPSIDKPTGAPMISLSDWDPFAKLSTENLEGSTNHSTQANFSEWALPHQAWLNTGNASSLNFLTPGTISALQQYLANTSISGTHSFLQPFLSGPVPMPHAGNTQSQPSYMSSNDSERILSQPNMRSTGVTSPPDSPDTSAPYNLSPSAGTKMSSDPHQPNQSPLFIPTSKYRYFPSPSSNGLRDQTSSSSIFAPASGMKYFSPSTSSSVFTPVPDFSSMTSSAPPPASQCDLSGPSLMRSAQQPIRFHPGTSVSLKEGQFNVGLQSSSGGLLFNPPIMSVATSDNSMTSASSTFSSSSVHHPASQHNPFMQLMPTSTGISTDFVAQHQSTCTSTSSGSEISQLGSVSSMASQQTPSTIMRRKKLVAQSKLTKQPRVQAQQQKAMADGLKQTRANVVQAASLEINMQKNGNKVTLSASQKIQTSLGKSHGSDSSRCFIDGNPHHEGNKIIPGSCPTSGDPNARKQTKSQQTLSHGAAAVGANQGHRGPPNSEQCQHGHAPASSANRPPNHPNNHPTSGGNNANQQQVVANGNGTQTNNGNGSSCKYCNCCYCEFFGNGGPPQAPTSKNYPEIRERLRRKLKSKDPKDPDLKAEEHILHESASPVSHSPDTRDSVSGQPSVEELLSFIEGGKVDEKSKKAAKRARQKQRRDIDKQKADTSTDRSSRAEPSSSDVAKPAQEEVAKEALDQQKSGKKKKTKKSGRVEDAPKDSEEKSEDGKKTNISSSSADVVLSKVTAALNSVSISDSQEHQAKNYDPGSKGKSSGKSPEQGATKPAEKAGDESRRNDTRQAVADKQKANTNSAAKEGKNGVHAKSKDSGNNKLNKTANNNNASERGANRRQEEKKRLQNAATRKEQRYSNQADTEKGQKQQNKTKDPSSKKQVPSLLYNGLATHKTAVSASQPVESSPPLGQRSEKIKTQSTDPVADNGTKSESSTPEKGNQDSESAESRKARTRKQRKKERKTGAGAEKVLMDQVFLPREEDSGVHELDDAEKEIESFKRFCLDTSGLLNNRKKITVNWKDFSFKKNLSTH